MDKKWLASVNWTKLAEDIAKDEEFKEKINSGIKDNGNVYQPHKEQGDIKVTWPYFVAKKAKIDASGDIAIGPFFLMSDNAEIIRHDHPEYGNVPLLLQWLIASNKADPLVIENDVWLQKGSKVMPTVTKIHKGTILAHNAVLEDNTTCEDGIWAGSPAKLIGTRPYVKQEDINEINEDNIYDTLVNEDNS